MFWERYIQNPGIMELSYISGKIYSAQFNPAPPPPLYKGLKFGNKGRDEIFFLERGEGLD